MVYDAIACWTWNPNGWSSKLGVLDFAGGKLHHLTLSKPLLKAIVGTPVHISSGCAALAYSLVLRPRRGYSTQELNYRPHNVVMIVIGTVFVGQCTPLEGT